MRRGRGRSRSRPASTTSTRPGSASWRPERLTRHGEVGARRRAPPRAPACAAGLARAPSAPSGTMSPVSSASGMKSRGGSRPRLGVLPAHQRLDADDLARRRGRRSAGSATRSSPRSMAAAQRRFSISSRCDGARRAWPRRRARSRARPRSLARYIAASASRSSVVGVGSPAAARAMPMLARHEDVGAGQGERLGQRRRDPLGDARARPRSSVELLAQHDELVAAEAGDGVVRAQRRPQPLGDAHSSASPARVAEAVVDHLEVVEVEEQHRRPRADAASAARAPAEPVEEAGCGWAARSARRGWPGARAGPRTPCARSRPGRCRSRRAGPRGAPR